MKVIRLDIILVLLRPTCFNVIMADAMEKPILFSGKYEVPWPHKIVTHGGVHPATKFKKTFKIAGIIMIVLGVLSIIVSIAITTETLRITNYKYTYAGTGYWAGGSFLVTGIVLLVCGKYNVMRCTLLLAFVLSTFTMIGTGFVCYWNFTGAIGSGLVKQYSLSVLEGIIGGISLLEGCVALAVTLVSGSTLCTCSNQVGYRVATGKNGLTLQIA